MKNPIKVIRAAQEKRLSSKEASVIFKERLETIFVRDDNESVANFRLRKTKNISIITSSFKAKGVTVEVLYKLQHEIVASVSVFIKRVLRSYQVEFVSEVVDKDAFSRIVIILRDMYAEDIAHQIICEDFFRIVIDDFLLRSSK